MVFSVKDSRTAADSDMLLGCRVKSRLVSLASRVRSRFSTQYCLWRGRSVSPGYLHGLSLLSDPQQ